MIKTVYRVNLENGYQEFIELQNAQALCQELGIDPETITWEERETAKPRVFYPVKPVALRKAFLAHGVTTLELNQLIQNADEDIQIEWEYSTEFSIHDSVIYYLCNTLSLSKEVVWSTAEEN